MENKLKNKIALVTGASKGIGASIAKHFAAQGAKVIVNYASSQQAADSVVKEIMDQGGIATAIQADVTKPEDISSLFEQVKSTYGGLDILVNNAGVFEYLPIEDLTVTSIERQFNINVLGAILSIQQAVKLFGTKGGNIINISSQVSKTPLPSGLAYAATKAAIDAVTISLSKEFSGKNIRINSLLPGIVETEGSRQAGFIGTDTETELVSKTPLGRTGQPGDIAKVAVFLASEDSGWITGEHISVTGGIFGL